MMKAFLPRMTGILLALTVAVAALAAPLYAAGTNERLMHRMLLRHAPSAETGLPEAEYLPVARMITSFLAGETAEFQHTFTGADGATYICFNTTERAHMADCAALFRLCRVVLMISLAAAACMAAAAFLLRRQLRCVVSAMRWTLAALSGVIAALAIWAAADFNALFILFHRISFANDLWLLNPATDLLIRLMPTGFFVEYAAMCGFAWLAVCVLCMLAAVMLRRRLPPDTNRGT